MDRNRIINDKKLEVLLHVLTWLLLFVFPSYYLYLDSGNDTSFLERNIVQTSLYAIAFYINYFWFAPALFFKGKKASYFLITFCFTGVLVVVFNFADSRLLGNKDVKPPLQEMVSGNAPAGSREPVLPIPGGGFSQDRARPGMHRPSKKWPVYNFLLTSLIISGFSLGLRFSDKLKQNEKVRQEAEKAKLNSELAFLKNQINPHFFFNTLNNIYALIESNPESGRKAIHRLSKMMRYMLYETQHDRVTLSQEIDFLKNFLELEKLRISDKVSLEIIFPQDIPDVALPPLVFLPFIENAFKHGISSLSPSFISIRMTVAGEKLDFFCINCIHAKPESARPDNEGIGLENVRKRLSLLFPGKHNLNISATQESFNVSLSLNLEGWSKT